MKVVYLGDGEIAWFEPENEADEALLARAKKNNWDAERVLANMNKKEEPACASS